MTRKELCFVLLLLSFLFITNPGWADMIIHDVSLTPSSPTTEDSVTAIISGTLTSTLDSACFEETMQYDEGEGNYRIDIYLSHVVHAGTDLPRTFDFQIAVPLGQLEEGNCELSVVTLHTLLLSPPQVYCTLDALTFFAVSCTCTSTTVSEEETIEQPAGFALSQNYPNPFNQSTNIAFTLANSGFVDLRIYDLLGRKVRTLVYEHLSSGYKSVLWDGKNDSGKDVASGIYFYQIKIGNFSETKELVLLK